MAVIDHGRLDWSSYRPGVDVIALDEIVVSRRKYSWGWNNQLAALNQRSKNLVNRASILSNKRKGEDKAYAWWPRERDPAYGAWGTN